jgi:hypothetical protein
MNLLKKKILFILFFIKGIPYIVFRLFKIYFRKREYRFQYFKISNDVGINGAFNQLEWQLENALFLTLSNSTKIYLNSNKFVFKVSNQETFFKLKVYTLNGVKEYSTSFNVVNLERKSFDDLALKNNKLGLKKENTKLANKINALKLKKHSSNNLLKLDVSVYSKTVRVNEFKNDALNTLLKAIGNLKNIIEITQIKQDL